MGFHFSVQLTGDMFSNLTTGHRAASVAANRLLITIIILFYEEGEHTFLNCIIFQLFYNTEAPQFCFTTSEKRN